MNKLHGKTAKKYCRRCSNAFCEQERTFALFYFCGLIKALQK